ncbi:uncharacterized protein trim33l isoform X2 [Salminus brasiliensis]|uniref:uncharacterized protein trim33l isoform X2 n=1 Tax=Salminus brasiliensis TaxID=930266 RepID=UPI003B82C637
MVFSGREDEGGEGESGNTQNQTEEGWEACSACRVSLNSSTAPKLLPCLHAVCKACATENNDGGSTKECSVCGQSFNIAEVTDCFIFEDSAPKCGGCEESALSGWCVQCEEALCSDCVSAHKRVKMTRNHTVIPEEPPSGFTSSLRCSSHRQERLKFFCLNCDELTCRDCQLINHRGHSFLLLEEALLSQKGQLQKLMHSIMEQRITLNASLKDLDARLNNITESKATAKMKMASLVQDLQLRIFSRGHQLLKEVEDLYLKEQESLMKMKTALKSLENRQVYITAFIRKILSTKGQCVLLHKKQIAKRVEGLLSQKTSLIETVLQPSLLLNQDIHQICKTFGSVKAVRVPYTISGKNRNDPKPRDKQFLSTSLNPAQLQTVNHAGASSVSPPCAPVQTSVRVSPALPQSVSSRSSCPQPPQSKRIVRSQSDPQSQSNFSIQGQTISKGLRLKQSNPDLAQLVLARLLPKSGDVRVSASHLNAASSVPVRSASLRSSSSLSSASSQSSKPNESVMVQSPSLTLNHPGSLGLPSPSLVTPSAQSGSVQGVFDSQPNILSGRLQQSFPVSQLVSVQSASTQTLNSNLPLQGVSTSGPLPVCQVPSTTHTVFVQHAQPIVVQSSPLLFSLLKNSNPLHQLAPVPTVKQTPVLTYAPQPTLLLTAPASVPAVAVNVTCNAPKVPTTATLVKSWHPVPTKTSCPLPVAPNIIVLPGSSNKDLASTVPSKPPLSSTETLPITSTNPDQSEYSTPLSQKPQCELPVQAPADSVYERNVSMRDRASPASEETDDNLPTSTVSETETKELTIAQEQCLPSSPSPDLISTVPVLEYPLNKSSVSQPKSQINSTLTMSFSEKPSTSKHWSIGMPTTLQQLLEQKAAQASVSAEETSASDAEHTSSPRNVFQSNGEMTRSDSVQKEKEEEEEDEAIIEWEFELPEDSNKSLCVSLQRLPISLPASGSPLPQFHIVSCGQADDIMLQEISEEQPIQRRLRIPAVPDAASRLQCSTPDGPSLDGLLNCAVCLSAGATLICAECGRNFHTHCHVPSVLSRPIEAWTCTLCQDVFDDSDPFSHDRLKEPYLSLQDQRRCEQLLLTLMCEEHSYLLFKASKRTAGSVEFDFIRGRLQGKRTPPYRSAAELVSDVWALFDVLSANSKNRDSVLRLQNSFKERLDIAFGKSLHASLLRPLSKAKQKGAPETELDKDKAKTTLKKMRQFLAAKSGTVAKRPRTGSPTEDPSKNSPCSNP